MNVAQPISQLVLQPPLQEPIRAAPSPSPPSITSPSVPVQRMEPPAGGAPRRRNGKVAVAMAAAVALFAGVAIGFAIGMPGRHDLTSQRDAARTELARTEADLSAAEAAAGQAQADLEAAQGRIDELAAARDACSTAANEVAGLVGRWETFWETFGSYAAAEAGSAEQQELIDRLDEQWAAIQGATDAVNGQLTACRAAT